MKKRDVAVLLTVAGVDMETIARWLDIPESSVQRAVEQASERLPHGYSLSSYYDYRAEGIQ